MIQKIRLSQLAAGDVVNGQHNASRGTVELVEKRAGYTVVKIDWTGDRVRTTKYSDRDYSGRDEPFFFVER